MAQRNAIERLREKYPIVTTTIGIPHVHIPHDRLNPELKERIKERMAAGLHKVSAPGGRQRVIAAGVIVSEPELVQAVRSMKKPLDRAGKYRGKEMLRFFEPNIDNKGSLVLVLRHRWSRAWKELAETQNAG